MKNYNVDSGRWIDDESISATAPFVIRGGEYVSFPNGPLIALVWENRYYFWFFGYVAKLPYEPEVEVPTVDARSHAK